MDKKIKIILLLCICVFSIIGFYAGSQIQYQSWEKAFDCSLDVEGAMGFFRAKLIKSIFWGDESPVYVGRLSDDSCFQGGEYSLNITHLENHFFCKEVGGFENCFVLEFYSENLGVSTPIVGRRDVGGAKTMFLNIPDGTVFTTDCESLESLGYSVIDPMKKIEFGEYAFRVASEDNGVTSVCTYRR